MPFVFSHVEYCDMHFVYGFCNGNSRAAVVEYQRRFPDRRIPSRRVFTRIYQTLRDNGCYKTLHVSGIFSAHHQEFSTVHSSTMSPIFMLPCIVIDFFLNNQPDVLIIQIYSVIKLYMFRVSSVPIIRNFLLYIRHW